MKKMRKSGLISWCRVHIIIGYLDCPICKDLSICALLALSWVSSLLDTRVQILLVGTVGAPYGRKQPVPSSSPAMHVRTEVIVSGIGDECKTDSKVLVCPCDDTRIQRPIEGRKREQGNEVGNRGIPGRPTIDFKIDFRSTIICYNLVLNYRDCKSNFLAPWNVQGLNAWNGWFCGS